MIKKIFIILLSVLFGNMLFISCTDDSCSTESENIVPICRITSPEANEKFISGEDVTINVVAADDDGIDSVKFYIDDILEFTDIEAPYFYYYNTDNLALGEHSIKVSTKDRDGNEAIDLLNIELVAAVNILPTCKITSPIDYEEIVMGSNVTIDVMAVDDSNVDSVRFYIDDIFEFTDFDSSYSWEWNTENAISGDHQIKVVAYDDAGGKSSDSIFVDILQIISFSDPKLEERVREVVLKPEGDIFKSDVENLISFEAQGLQITDLSGLEYFKSLKYLNLGCDYANGYPRYNSISDITPLSELKNLTTLYLDNNRISDLTPISALSELTDLYLGNLADNHSSNKNQISDLSPLADLAGLITLSLGYNQINNLSSLSNLVNLKNLYMSGNPISDLSILATLTELKGLAITSVEANDFTPISDLVQLTQLFLGSNQITDISVIADLTNLTDLYLSSNKITDISSLSTLDRLVNLSLSFNQIVDTAPLSNLKELNRVYLKYNQIVDIKPFVDNDEFAENDYLDLVGNPLSSTSINTYIPQLEERGVEVGFNTVK